MAENKTIDLGSGFTGELRYHPDGTGELLGVMVEGPRGARCSMGKPRGEERCSGWVPLAGSDAWSTVSLEPMTLTPSIRCGCDCDDAGAGQHGFITNGRWVNAGGITA